MSSKKLVYNGDNYSNDAEVWQNEVIDSLKLFQGVYGIHGYIDNQGYVVEWCQCDENPKEILHDVKKYEFKRVSYMKVYEVWDKIPAISSNPEYQSEIFKEFSSRMIMVERELYVKESVAKKWVIFCHDKPIKRLFPYTR